MAAGNKSQGPWDLPWKTRLFITAYHLGVDYSRRFDGTINRRLMSFFDPKSPLSTKPINGVTSSDVTVDSSRNIWYRLYVPSSAAAHGGSKLPLVVYFHGGGFAFCAPDSKPYHDLCNRIAAEVNAVVVSVNYRLSPEHPFPTQYEDGFEALKFLDAAQSDAILPSFADLGRCFIAGDSAGGNIGHHVALRASSNHDFKRLKVVGLVALQPFFGGEERTGSELRLTGVPMVNVERTDWLWKAFLPEGSDRNHEAANVFFCGDQSERILSGMEFPATMVVVGGFDPLQEWQRKYSEGLNRCGKEVKLVEYPDAIHGFYGFPELPQGALFIQDLTDFIQNH